MKGLAWTVPNDHLRKFSSEKFRVIIKFDDLLDRCTRLPRYLSSQLDAIKLFAFH
jgi:hypothetical protein